MIWRFICCVMFTWPGVFLLRLVWRDVQVVKASKSWPSVPGRVVHTSYREKVVKTSRSTSTFYVPLVQYEYQVGNETYLGTRLEFSEESCANTEKLFEILGSLPIGSPVAVFYDPAKPGDAVLQRRDRANVFMAFAGWVLVVVGIAALFNVNLLR